jgi:hypothetical protein
MHELARAVIDAGDTFYVRRLLQRLERGEVVIEAALVALRVAAVDKDRSAAEGNATFLARLRTADGRK